MVHLKREKFRDINPVFKKVTNRKKMISWILKHYFDEVKHADRPWFDLDVNAGNVLEYISEPKNNFPQTPINLVDFWHTVSSFKDNLKEAEEEYSEYLTYKQEKDTEVVKKQKYQIGEYTLEEIGKSIGGLTPTMINKLSTSGTEKFKKLTDSVSLEDMDEEQNKKLVKQVLQYRAEAVQEFSSLLKQSKGKTRDFVNMLIKKQIMTQHDVKLMDDREVEALTLLVEKDSQKIEQILLADIEQDDNIFKSFQAAVSRKAFPAKKRGRPKRINT